MLIVIRRLRARVSASTILFAALLAGAALALCGAVLAFVTASDAAAAPVLGPSGMAFYTAPSPLPSGSPGELISYRPATVNLNVTLPEANAWNVMYLSTNQQGEPDVVTGTVIVPKAAWSGGGVRPVVSYAEGTQGLAQRCAPSIQMAEGTEYDGGATIAALRKGYAVAVTDYQGYTTGSVPTYIAGRSEGHAVLDAVRAARQIPGSGVSSSAPTIIWGYSQGGQAASWAGQLAPTYAPDIKLAGVAAGGVPSNLQAVAEFDNGSVGTAFGLDALVGLNVAYPTEFNLASFSNEAGLAAAAKLISECAIQSLAEFRDVNLAKYTIGEKTFAQVEAEHPQVQRILSEQQLGGTAIAAPVYHYHGLEDQFVPVAQDVALHETWCSLGVKDDFKLYPGDHLLTDPTAIPDVMSWIGERLAGRTAPSTCGQHAANAALPSAARTAPETGDLIVPLPAWQLKGSVTEAKSGIAMEVPSGATLTAEGDITTGKLTASLHIPPIHQTVVMFGLPITISGALTPVGTITGSVSFSDSGVFSQSANGAANMVVGSVGILPIGCTTVEPIQMPLSISEPVNALASGGFGMSTTVTVPPFGGCGLYGPLLTSMMSGPGNPINMTATPPPPISW
jgi:pimeloyl-ACP methyl ester carboxylesterase